MDYNKELKNRLYRKMRTLDKKNNGDYLKTMENIIKYAGNSVRQDDYTRVSVLKAITMNGCKGIANVIVYFNTKTGEVEQMFY